MKKKEALEIMLTLFLIGVLTSAFNPAPIGAVGKGEFAQETSPIDYASLESSTPPPVQWNKTYGGTLDDGAYSVVQTSDGGYTIAGYTESFSVGSTDLSLIKTNSTGNMIWNKTYGGPYAEVATSLVQTMDGKYTLAGYTYSSGAGGSDFWLVKTDLNGNMIWNKTYGGTQDDFAWRAIQTSDGGYTIVGYTMSFGNGGWDFWLVRTDSNGNIQWNKTYGTTNDEQAYSLIQTSDQGYTLAGRTNYTGNNDFWLVRTDSTGNMIWNKTYGTTNDEQANSLVQTTDGGCAIAGYTYSPSSSSTDFWMVKTDASGNTQWNKTYGTTSDEQAYSLIQTIDGGYALAGYTWPSGANKDLWLVKTNSVGTAQWNNTYGGANHDVGHSIIQTNDTGYAVAGYTESFAAGGGDSWLTKFAPPPPPDVAITNITTPKNVVEKGVILPVNVTVQNQGNYTEVFNITVYYDSLAINQTAIELVPDASATLTFNWNTTDVPPGEYVLSANATVLPGENDTYDNTRTYGTVYIFSPITSITVHREDNDYLITIESNITITSLVATGSASSFKTLGPAGIVGYINITLPTGLNTTEIKVLLDTVPQSLTTSTNGTHYFVYFELTLSVHDVLVRYAVADIAIVNITTIRTVVADNCSRPEHAINNTHNYACRIFNATILNQGDFAETFNLTVYANTTIIQRKTITLPSGNSTILCCTWNTTGFGKGNYTLSVCVAPVLGEADVDDNNATYGLVRVVIPGNFNGDFIVNMVDIYTEGILRFMAEPGDPRYSANSDINDDDVINMQDIYTGNLHFMDEEP